VLMLDVGERSGSSAGGLHLGCWIGGCSPWLNAAVAAGTFLIKFY